mmetsp:Transcript_47159/g.57083  ORF Transcript_47159/g.57083 Transcript_47159/m.57083 type:complete len:209 (-) Transcript_47159:146-772(-)
MISSPMPKFIPASIKDVTSRFPSMMSRSNRPADGGSLSPEFSTFSILAPSFMKRCMFLYTRNRPTTVIAIDLSIPSSFWSGRVQSGKMPALTTARSYRLSLDARRSTSSRAEQTVPMSPCTKSTTEPDAPHTSWIFDTALSPLSLLRPTMVTCAPAFARACAVPNPTPRVPPIRRAFFPDTKEERSLLDRMGMTPTFSSGGAFCSHRR